MSEGEPTLPAMVAVDWPPNVWREIDFVGRFLADVLLIEVEDARHLHDGALAAVWQPRCLAQHAASRLRERGRRRNLQ